MSRLFVAIGLILAAMTAAEAVGERTEISDSIEVTLTFRLTPIISKDHLEVSVAFKRDPTLRTHIPR